jgi:hypothetical protein
VLKPGVAQGLHRQPPHHLRMEGSGSARHSAQ